MNTEIIEGFPLSAQQKRTWLVMRQGGRGFCAQVSARLLGEVHGERLRAVVEGVVSRHEMLRTTFHLLPGMYVPIQTVAAVARPDWREHDLRGLTATGAEATRGALLAEEQARDFDFEHGPLLRAALFTESEGVHTLSLTLPLLCADAGSLLILINEIGRRYAARHEDAEDDGESLQYAQYVAWQEELFSGDESEAGRTYWREVTSAATHGVTLPFEKENGAASGVVHSSGFTQVGSELSEAIAALCRRQHTSPNVFLLACWQTLLWRLCGESEFLVAAAHDGRDYEELQGVVGPVSKYLPHRVEARRCLPFSDFLAQVARQARAASDWQEFYNVAGGRDQLLGPVGFEFLPAFEVVHAGGLTLAPEALRVGPERFSLQLTCRAEGAALLTSLDYDPGLFQAEEIDRLAERFRTLLENVCRSPSDVVGRLGLVGEAERRQLIVGFNDTAAGYPEERCIHELIESQATLTPHKVAVVRGDERLTYGELEARAGRLARRLRALGVGPESSVGILLERSADMLIAILGALKAGAAYVPFDPAYPRERLDYMMADARVSVLLTHERFLPELPDSGAPVICLDRDPEAEGGGGESSPTTRVLPSNAAYVIYTSGSTGRPKGVVVTHRNLVHSTTARFSYYAEPVENFLLTSPFVFDSSVVGIFWTLCRGGTLTLPETNFQQNLPGLLRLIGEGRVSHMLCVPSLYGVLLEQSQKGLLDNLRAVIVAGESCPRRLVERHYELLPGVPLYNEYGPTEVSVWSSVYKFLPGDGGGPVLIGRPISNTSIYLLDEDLQPAPLGVPGEIYLGGAGVSRGYLKRPGLTAERFLPHPFSERPGERVYRTGDLARHRADGQIEFLGRVDQQVKINGHRIELGEIESVIEQHPLVCRAAVVASERTPGDYRLVAYLVPDARQAGSQPGARTDAGLLPDEVRSFLKEKLPAYMIPAAFVILDELPLTPNGKIDRRALPAPEEAPSPGRTHVAPRTEAEHLLAEVWREVLGVEQVGVHDSFFERGGDSIKGIVLINKVQERLGENVQLVALLEAPRIADLAAHLSENYPQAISRYFEAQGGDGRPAPDEARNGGQAGSESPEVGGDAEADSPLSLSQQRLWFLAQLEPEAPTYNIPGAVRLEGPLDVAVLGRSFDGVVRRHEILRSVYPSNDGRPARVLTPELNVALPLQDLSHLPPPEKEAEARRMMTEEARKPFDIGAGPLLRAALLRMDEREHILLVTMHHIIADGWSAEILIRELAALYGTFSRGAADPLAPLPAQYSDFARWQRRLLRGEALERQLAYWRRQLSGAPPALALPTDYPRPAFQTSNGATLSFSLPPQLTGPLTAISHEGDATLFMTLLAAFKVLLHYHTGQKEIVVGTDVANRGRAEFEGLIGFFVNQLVLRTPISADLSFREVLAKVREVALGVYAHQDVPFDRLVEALNVERDPSRNPLFQVLFVLHKRLPVGALDETGLRVSLLEPEVGTSAFDISVHITETDEGLRGAFRYNTDLFKGATISRLSRHFTLLLERIAARLDETVEALKEMLAAADGEERAAQELSRQEANRQKYRAARRKAFQ